VYAIIETGSKQYKVSKGDILEVELLSAEKETSVNLDKVLLVCDGEKLSVGKPFVEGSSVECDVVGEKRGAKTISFKYRRRHASSKRKVGHRQNYTILKVKDIIV
jgi:large subunit ribosomal protein L21